MRHFLLRFAAAVLLLAGLGRADYVLPFPAGTYPDSAAVNAVLPSAAFSDSQTTTRLSMDRRILRLDVTWGNVPNWGAMAGIRLPFNRRWAPVDFSMVSSVTFKYKPSDAATRVQFAPNSDKYPGALAGVQRCVTLNGSTSGKTANVPLPTGIDYLDWMVRDHPEDVHLTWDDVAKEVKSLQFQPMPVYNGAGTAVTSKSSWLEISEVYVVEMIDLVPYLIWLSSVGSQCSGSRLDLGTDGALAGIAGPGVRWGGYVDTTGSVFERGLSSLVDVNGDKDPVERGGTALGIRANLRKGDAGAHPYAGWAGLGARFHTQAGGDTALDLTGLTAVSFRLRTDAAFDRENLTGVLLKLRTPLVGDSVAFFAGIGLGPSVDTTVCVDLAQLSQPPWYTSKAGRTRFDPRSVAGLDWELRISQVAMDTASTSGFWIGDVKLWGTYAASGLSRSRSAAGPSLAAAYAGALRLSYALDGAASARVEVLRLDGSRVASFEAPGSVSGQAFPMMLGQGTYLAVVRSGSIRLVAPFTVAR